MNIFDALPSIAGIIDKVIPNPNEREKLKLELQKVEATENVSRLNALGGMLSNNNWFVSGAIPAILWIIALSIFNNFVLLPWAAVFGGTLPEVALPEPVWTLAGWIITGLLGKKVIDNNEWYRKDGTLFTPSRKMVDRAVEQGKTEPVGANKDSAYYDRRVKEEYDKMKGRMNANG